MFQKTRIAKISMCTSNDNAVVYTRRCVSADSVVVAFKEGLGDIGLVCLQDYQANKKDILYEGSAHFYFYRSKRAWKNTFCIRIHREKYL